MDTVALFFLGFFSGGYCNMKRYKILLNFLYSFYLKSFSIIMINYENLHNQIQNNQK
jgi:hypothetical protein